jgi:hypothetical protein
MFAPLRSAGTSPSAGLPPRGGRGGEQGAQRGQGCRRILAKTRYTCRGELASWHVQGRTASSFSRNWTAIPYQNTSDLLPEPWRASTPGSQARLSQRHKGVGRRACRRAGPAGQDFAARPRRSLGAVGAAVSWVTVDCGATVLQILPVRNDDRRPRHAGFAVLP